MPEMLSLQEKLGIVAMLSATSITAILLWVFGLKCIAHGTYCGPCGHPDGGALMLPFAVICSIAAFAGISCSGELLFAYMRERADPTMSMGEKEGGAVEDEESLLG